MEERVASRYVTAEYEDLLEDYADEVDATSEEARAVFVAECAKFEDLFREDTPLSAVRKIAYQQTKKRL